MNTKIISLICLLSVCSFKTPAAEDKRPVFDKSPYIGTLWTQVNPWWTPDKPRHGGAHGGPNYTRKIYPEDPVLYWKTAMEECKAKGMTGWQFELTVPTPGFGDTLKQAIKAAEELGDFKLAVMLGMYRPAGGVEEAIQQLFTQFDMFAEEYKNSDAFFRIDGAPVLSIYSSWDYTPEEWLQIQSAFEGRYGKAIWLANFWWGTYTFDTKADELRKWMPVFDGCTAYANWGEQKELYRIVSEVMKNEFPQKIFEGTVHNTYSVHYTHAGIFTEAGRKYRASWESMLDCRPDSVVMTNLFDHYENSLILPCYEREDFLLRYSEFQMENLYGSKAKLSKEPETVVTSYIDMVAGYRDLIFEVVTFPVDSEKKNYTYILELLDESGAPVHTFPAVSITLDELKTQEFVISSAPFAGRLLIPRLQAVWQGETQKALQLPPVWIDPALRGSLMWWARSTVNAIHPTSNSHDWKLNGNSAGTVVNWFSTNGKGYAEAKFSAPDIARIRIMRNGEEIWTQADNDFQKIVQFEMPFPALNDDYYWLEMESSDGKRFTSLPIWVTANPQADKVQTVIADGTGNYIPVELPPGRIPVFYYPCAFSSGSKLFDIGGLPHNANYIQGTPLYNYGSLLRTGYRHYVNDYGTNPNVGKYGTDADGRGFIRLEDGWYYILTGGTAFPLSGTYEISIRPESTGSTMGLLGTINNAINIYIDSNGFIKAERGLRYKAETDSAGYVVRSAVLKSNEPVKTGEWTKIAVTYDCNVMKLYINNELHDQVEGSPNFEHFSMNYMSVGCGLQFLVVPVNNYTGDIRDIRMTGRALPEYELL